MTKPKYQKKEEWKPPKGVFLCSQVTNKKDQKIIEEWVAAIKARKVKRQELNF